ncbi:hypothetical protein JCM9279_001135 [Rhodotorula babjevae]
MMDAPPPAALLRLPIELLLVIVQEAAHSSYQWNAVRDRHNFIMRLAEVCRRFREISIELRNKVVFFELPHELEDAEASGRLIDVLARARHITATRIDTGRSLEPVASPPPRLEPGPFDFLFAEARDPVPPHLAPSASSTFSALQSLHLVDVQFVPPYPTRLPHLKFLRLGFIMVDKASFEAWLTPEAMPALIALRCGEFWQMLPGTVPQPYAPDLDEGLIAQLDAVEFDEGCYSNWQAHRHERVAVLEHAQDEDLVTRLELPFILPDDLRLAARELFRRRDAGELDVLWYDDDELGEELICAVWWRYILERKASAAAQASEGEGRSV